MIESFFATLNPMLMLFTIIAIGFILRKTKILPEDAGKTMAKLETWVFCPALSFVTMVNYCTPETLATHATNILLSLLVLAVAIGIGILLARIFVRKKSAERGIYCYALVFANSGYMGDSIVIALFGDEMLSYYKIFCLPVSLAILTWGISMLIPKGEKKGDALKVLLNPSVLALLLGVVAGLLNFGKIMPSFLGLTLDGLKSCMGPVAMLLAGFTIAGYKTREIIGDKKVCVASVLRITLIPAVLIAMLFGAKELANLLFDLNIGNTVLYLAFFAYASALGLNTIVFPEAYGGNPKTGASMALISHTMGVILIPLMYSLMTLIFGSV
ncbi:MAG: AEC family transporter [Clostridia bacterium]|nr:AEC family transporter [Clostridia bacterium]